MTETAQSMRDHWWWRPGWRVGRSFYTWHVTFDNQPAVRRLAADYAPVLNDLPILDLIPVRWLHLTMQGIGVTDEVNRTDVDAPMASGPTSRWRTPTPPAQPSRSSSDSRHSQ